MAKKVKMPGRIESTSLDGIVTGAAEIYDDGKEKMQNVINTEVSAELLRLKNEKQDNLTFDNAPTEDSRNPVTSGGVFTAEKALSDAIEAILILIPSAATALNQLADKNFVNSSIATDTATFRGTSSIGLSEAQFLEWANGLTHDMNDYVFWQTIDEAGNTIFKRYKWNGTQWLYEYTLNNSSFTADQWAAIMSGITSALVEKLNGLPTNAALQQALNSKQNALSFDNVPTEGSNNPVKSGGVYSVVKEEEEARLNLAQTVSEIGGDVSQIEDVIPTGATSINKLVENASMEAYVASIIQNITSSFTLATADGHINLTLTQTNGQVDTLTLTSSDIASAQDVANLQQLYNNLQQSKPEPVTALPETGQQQGVIYRLAGTTSYSDYMWNGSTWVLMATYNNAVDPRPKKASQNLVTSGGVFDNMGALDVSELNATENPHTPAIYVDLSAAIATIPTDYQKGGMSIKFIQGTVQSSDNMYVQYRYMGTDITGNPNPFLDTANWQGVDDEPTAGSKNLVKSGGVFEFVLDGTSLDKADYVVNGYFSENTGFNFHTSWKTYVFNKRPEKITYTGYGDTSSSTDIFTCAFFNSQEISLTTLIGGEKKSNTILSSVITDIPSSTKCFIITTRIASGTGESATIKCRDLESISGELNYTKNDIEFSKMSLADADDIKNEYFDSNGWQSSGSWKSYIFYNRKNAIQNLYAVLYGETSSSPSIYSISFFNDEEMLAGNFISGIKLSQKKVVFGVPVPVGCKAIALSSRTASGTDENATIFSYSVNRISAEIEKINSQILELDEKIDEETGDLQTEINEKAMALLSLDNADFTVNGYFSESTGFNSHPNWKTYVFNIKPESVKYTAYGDTSSNTPIYTCAFFGDGKIDISNLLGGYKGRNHIIDNLITDIPSSTKYFIITTRIASGTDESAEIKLSAKDASVDNKTEINSILKSYELELDSADSVRNSYYDSIDGWHNSSSWKTYVFYNTDNNIQQINHALLFGSSSSSSSIFSIAFFSNTRMDMEDIISGEVVVNSKAFVNVKIPNNCKAVAFCSRVATSTDENVSLQCLLSNKKLVSQQKDNDARFEDLQAQINQLSNTKKFGHARIRGISNPDYDVVVGDRDEVMSHFKMALVKDGVVQYYLNQTNINKEEQGLYDSILDGTDGDVLLVNDIPLYILSKSSSEYDISVIGLTPFEFDGITATYIPTRGMSLSFAYVDNINDGNADTHESLLGSGKAHYCRKASNIAWKRDMMKMSGKYVPYENNEEITYVYDANKSFIENGAYLPSTLINQNTAERAATNKNVADITYTNKDLLSIEIIATMLYAEYGTRNIHNYNMFGCGFQATGTPTESLFTNGTQAINGMRFKNSDDEWVYCSFKDVLTTEFSTIECFLMLTYWTIPWQIMEQHLAISYATENNIPNNTWFVYNENEYKYVNVGDNNILTSGIMTCVLFKKFKSKLDDIFYNGVNCTGNDVEFVISSAIYRGLVIDISSHEWVTGLNCVLNGDYPGNFYFYTEHNYKKYLMNKSYSPIASDALYDFEKQYEYAGLLYSNNNVERMKDHSDKSIFAPKNGATGATSNSYNCFTVFPSAKKANATTYPKASTENEAGVKIVTGVKHGYGPYLYNEPYLYLYLWHPREYCDAMAGYSSFVCQNVIV